MTQSPARRCAGSRAEIRSHAEVSQARRLSCLVGEPERKAPQMTVHMAEAKIKVDNVTDVETAARKLFAAIDAAQPGGIRYAWCMQPDGETFVALVEVEDGAENPILALPEYHEIQAHMGEWIAEPPPGAQQLSVIGSYRLF